MENYSSLTNEKLEQVSGGTYSPAYQCEILMAYMEDFHSWGVISDDEAKRFKHACDYYISTGDRHDYFQDGCAL